MTAEVQDLEASCKHTQAAQYTAGLSGGISSKLTSKKGHCQPRGQDPSHAWGRLLDPDVNALFRQPRVYVLDDVM